MNTMTLFPSQYVEEAPVARPAAQLVVAPRPDAGLNHRTTPIRRALAGAAVYALIHAGLIAMGIGADLAPGIGILGLAILLLALSIERYGAAMSVLAAANLVVTVTLVHPELAVMPLLAAALQLLMVLALVVSEVIASNTAAMTLRRADLGLLEGSV
ncbi:MAG: hypothetical protein KAG82_04765 [Alcanivoracaceae bacterium]|jgi:hypothetical protein|nr:hypothetical protein [Alcanivoracaceae bacterium]